jgi:hypothetical protein
VCFRLSGLCDWCGSCGGGRGNALLSRRFVCGSGCGSWRRRSARLSAAGCGAPIPSAAAAVAAASV